MNMEYIIQEYYNIGIILSYDEVKGIHVKSPPGVLTENIRQELKRYKPEIVNFLKSPRNAVDSVDIVKKNPRVSTLSTDQRGTFEKKQELGSHNSSLVDFGKKQGSTIKKAFYQQRTKEQTVLCLKQLQEKLAPYHLPPEGKEAVEKILTRSKPKGFSDKFWTGLCFNTEKITPHLTTLIQCGWTLKNIFGCHPTHPSQRYECMGLLLLLEDNTIHEVTEGSITLKTRTGAIQTYRRHVTPLPDQITLMELEEDQNHHIPQQFGSIFANQEDGSSSLLRSFNEIKHAGLEEYYDYFQERAAIREFDSKLPKEEAEWQAMNDTVYKFMEDHHVDQGSIEVNRFIKRMLF
jgi:hypothetical protein